MWSGTVDKVGLCLSSFDGTVHQVDLHLIAVWCSRFTSYYKVDEKGVSLMAT